MGEEIFDCIVIGKGLIGSAAVKYLSREIQSVAVLGPDEPADLKKHRGVFSSHYDSGRITRILDGDRTLRWANLARASIERYRQIESESGIEFFSAVGCIKVAPDDEEGREYIAAHEYVGNKLAVNYERLDIQDLHRKYPFLNFPAGSLALVEFDSAGWIDPRKLIEAQLAIAKANCARIIPETAVGTRRLEDGTIEIATSSGRRYESRKVLIAAGAFSNFNNLLGSRLNLRVRGETVVLGQVSEKTARELATMPSIVWPHERENICKHIYIVPVVTFPDGNHYVKIGARASTTIEFYDLASVADWFHSEGSPEVAAEERKVIEELLPSISFLSWTSKPCIITDTSTTYPYFGEVDSNIFVATGGNGYGAKSSDELGRLSSRFVLEGADSQYDPDAFQVLCS